MLAGEPGGREIAKGDDPQQAGAGHVDEDEDKPKSETADATAPDAAAPQTPFTGPVAMPVAAAPVIQLSGRDEARDDAGASPIEATGDAASTHAGPALPQQAAVAPPPHAAADGLPSLLASQMPAASASGPASHPLPSYAIPPQQPTSPTIVAQPGQIGRDIGVEIARHVAAGRNEVLIRLSPAEMGRVDVRLSFDDKGTLHAAVSADSHVALDMLRRDAGDLGRSLADAGIAADHSSFSFDSRGGSAGQFAQQQGHGGSGGDARDARRGSGPLHDPENGDAAPYRLLRASGRIDLMA